MARAKKKKAPPRVGQMAKATSKRKAKKKATRKATKKKAKPKAKKKTTRRTRPRSAEAIMRAASKEKRTTRFRYDKEGNIVGFYVPLKHQTKAEQKKATKAMVAACSAGALRQGWSPRVSCSYRTTPTEAGAGLAYARWGFPKGYRKPKHVSNPAYTVRGLTVKTFKDEDGDWGFAVYSPMGEPLAIGSGEPSEKVAAREGKSEAKFQAEILEAEGIELRRGNPKLYTKAEIEKARKLGAAAFKAGKSSAPAQDSKIMAMIKPGPIGSSAELLEAWTNGWHTANVRAPVPNRSHKKTRKKNPKRTHGVRSLVAKALR